MTHGGFTDAEVICTWMEPKPVPLKGRKGLTAAPERWWKLLTGMTMHGAVGCIVSAYPAPILDACEPMARLGYLHEVEARLNDEQWWTYEKNLVSGRSLNLLGCIKAAIGATPEQKIAALAAVLRPIVEGSGAIVPDASNSTGQVYLQEK